MADTDNQNTEVVNDAAPVESADLPQNNDTPAQPEFSDAEKRALAQGWVPKDQYQGTGKWRDADEFLDRGELFSKIDEQNRRLRSQEMTLTQLKQHYKAVRETEYKRAIQSLRNEKAEAVASGDGARVVEIDDQIDATKAEQARIEAVALAQPVEPSQPHPAFLAWRNRNNWYDNNKAMRIFADNVGQEMAQAGETNPAKILEEVERQTKKEFSHKFTNPNRDKAAPVEGAGGKGSRQGGGAFELTDDERRVMKRFVDAKVLTEKEYIDDIKASRKGA